jgi:hypothetical protein
MLIELSNQGVRAGIPRIGENQLDLAEADRGGEECENDPNWRRTSSIWHR